MTTIAADAKAGLMASDSMWSDGDERGPIKKIHRVRGELIGLAGDLDQINLWLKVYRAGRLTDRPEKTAPDVDALRLSARGLDTWNRHEGWIPVPDRWAIGTGGKCARAAMAAGATAQRAVKIAIEIDANTNGTVRTYRLKAT